MTDRPTLHLTNWASRRLHGPGRKLTIMRRPRAWEHGDGRVAALIPGLRDLADVQDGTLDLDGYIARCRVHFSTFPLPPGQLWTTAGGGTPVADGDTLCCACSRANAAQGACHRVVAAELLAAAGWRVLLDGMEVEP
ncbi:MAG TPA: hypothetical protein VEB22_15305 [Phycisphaerales bacterium]|nr:hypothetical protein [Phycisphaerales bacterium]